MLAKIVWFGRFYPLLTNILQVILWGYLLFKAFHRYQQVFCWIFVLHLNLSFLGLRVFTSLFCSLCAVHPSMVRPNTLFRGNSNNYLSFAVYWWVLLSHIMLLLFFHSYSDWHLCAMRYLGFCFSAMRKCKRVKKNP